MSICRALLVLATRFLPVAFAFAVLPAAAADSGEFRPSRETYICPNVPKLGVDCFLDAVEHLYTMCRQVKSIELIEFGFEHAEEGVNGAKSEYCVDKHKASIAAPYQAALREASGSKMALSALRGLHELWVKALVGLKWKPPESNDEYQQRVSHAYDEFHERADLVRTALVESKAKVKAVTTARPQRGKAANAQRGTN